jgi:hypothetical protein
MEESRKSLTAEEIQALKESTTYVMLIAKGQNEGSREEARRLLYRYGTRRFGRPDLAMMTAVEAIRDREQLEGLLDRICDGSAQGWNDLFPRSPASKPKKDRPRRGDEERDSTDRPGTAG